MSYEKNIPFFEYQSRYTIRSVADYAKEVLLTHSDTVVMPADELCGLNGYSTSWMDSRTGYDVHLSAPEGLLEDEFIVLDTRDESSNGDVQYVFRAGQPYLGKNIETAADDHQKAQPVDEKVDCKTVYELLLQSGVPECHTNGETNERFWGLAADYALSQPLALYAVQTAARSVERGDLIEDGVEDVVEEAKVTHTRYGSFSVGVTASRLAIAAHERINQRIDFNQTTRK